MKFKSKVMTVMAVMMCFITVFLCKVSANAGKATSTPTELPLEEILDLSVNDNTESKTPLTPKGNLTSVDDVREITDPADKSTLADKEFITVESKNGNVFYIIIDRTGDTDNVYFLNTVDESDLFALMEEEEKEEINKVCTCIEKCELGAVNEGCAVCSKDVEKCVGVEKEPEKKEKKDKENSKSGSALPGLIILILLGSGGTFGWYWYKNKKTSTKGSSDPSDYEEDDEEDIEDSADYEADSETEPEDDSEDMDEYEESEEEE